jgi:hypothetical protein
MEPVWSKNWLWCKLLVAGDDEGMQGFVPIENLFKGRHFDRQIIILCVSWYTSFKLSLRDLVIMMADRGISVNHTTILRWVQRYLLEFEKRWRRYARSVAGPTAPSQGGLDQQTPKLRRQYSLNSTSECLKVVDTRRRYARVTLRVF